ncbi:MAG: hypothetical protein PVJ50_05345 [Desulfobacterales bacterium]|jgi:hypothetical protein
MKEIFVVILSILLVGWLIFLQFKKLKINPPNADLLVGVLNKLCSNSKTVRSGKTVIKNQKE